MNGKCIAIITARGGSKRIPRKNIRPFLGTPIIKYSIDAALAAQCFDTVMVSTDDAEIAHMAAAFGATVPFMRSPETSHDYATTAAVLLEVLQNLKEQGSEYEYCCCLYPTAPFVTAAKLRESCQKLVASACDAVISVTEFPYSIYRGLQVEGGGFLSFIWPEFALKRSQDIPAAYHDCGQFYFLRVDKFLETGKIFQDRTLPFFIPATEVQDIDTEEDWKMAEFKYRMINQQ